MRKAAGACLSGAVALGLCVRWVRPRVFSWGATSDEASQPMAGDELCPRPQLNAAWAVTVAAGPEDVWPWLVQWGWNRAGFYSYDLLDNLGRYTWARPTIVTELILMEIGDPFMMRKCLLGIKQRAERLGARRRREGSTARRRERPATGAGDRA